LADFSGKKLSGLNTSGLGNTSSLRWILNVAMMIVAPTGKVKSLEATKIKNKNRIIDYYNNLS